jgi:phenol hydroxylase P5 protein
VPAQTQTTVIEWTTLLAPEVKEIVLRSPETPISFEPGQWISLHLPVGEKPPLVRAYSLAYPPTPNGSLTVCFDRVPGGLGSSYLFERRVGDPLAVAGALGNFKLPDPLQSDLLLVARYTGVVPIRCMLYELLRRPLHRRVRLVYGAPREEDLIFHSEFQTFAGGDPNFDYYPVVLEPTDHWTGASGTELDLLEELAPAWLPFQPMVCGVREFTRPIRDLLQELGFERRAVRVENYD